MDIRKLAAVTVTLLAFAAACTDPAGPTSDGSAALVSTGFAAEAAPPQQVEYGAAASSLHRDIAALREATSAFHRVEVAEQAGYTVLVTHPVTGAACLADPEQGGMGRHMLNPALVGDDVVSVTSPEVVIYEPTPAGGLRLVGVEYVVPYAIRGPDETPPTLFGREFLHNATFGLWMLHVYVWKHNPSGMFATWNPAISCDADGAV